MPKSIGLNVLQLLTNTFHGWWQTDDGGWDWHWLLWELGDTKSHVCFSSRGPASYCSHPHVFSRLWWFRKLGLCPECPHPPGCRPGGILFRGWKAEGKDYLPMSPQSCEGSSYMWGGVDCRLKMWTLAHPILNRKCAPAKSDGECVLFEIASCCKYTRGLTL